MAIPVGLWLLGPLCLTAEAQEEVAIQVLPASVSLSPGTGTDVLLVISNNSSDFVRGAKLSVIHDQEVEVSLTSTDLGDIPSDGSVGIQATVGTSAGARIGGRALFVVNYETAGGTPNVVTTTLTVEERPPLQIQDLVQVTIHSSLRN
jgi:hypothetical protein